MDGDETMEDYINNDFYYRRVTAEIYRKFPSEDALKQIKKRGLDVNDYHTMDECMKIYKKYPSQEALDAIDNEYNKMYNNIQNIINKWNESFNQFPVWAQDIYKKI